MSGIISAVKGTRDFYPQQMARRRWLYDKIRQVSTSFGYQEYEAPILERLELYAAKSGEELVKEQAFVFPDRGGDPIALRPELTPSLARMVAQHQNELVFPLRWWSFGPFWRYERPQKGRTREFFQWNIDLIGVDEVSADAELLAIAAAFFQEVGLGPDEVVIRINDRRLMEEALQQLEIPAGKWQDVFHLIDRRDKMPPEDWKVVAREAGLSEPQVDQLLLDLADPTLWQRSAKLGMLFDLLNQTGQRDYFAFEAGVIRGLDYYTGTVFEAHERTGEGRAILGGGHYDNLVADVGGSPLPGVGFAMGDVMLELVLEKYGRLPELEEPPADVLVTVFDADFLEQSFALADSLRRTSGLRVACYPQAARLPKQLRYADRLRIPLVIILGPDENARGEITVKDLRTGKQNSLPREGAGPELAGVLAAGLPV